MQRLRRRDADRLSDLIEKLQPTNPIDFDIGKLVKETIVVAPKSDQIRGAHR
jgi:hypothetical protein